MDILDDHHLKI